MQALQPMSQRSVTRRRGTPVSSSSSSLARTVHAVTPAVVVVAAILLHAAERPLPLVTLLTLVSAAYGPAVWHACLDNRSGIARHLGTDDTETERPASTRDVVMGVEVTR